MSANLKPGSTLVPTQVHGDEVRQQLRAHVDAYELSPGLRRLDMTISYPTGTAQRKCLAGYVADTSPQVVVRSLDLATGSTEGLL